MTLCVLTRFKNERHILYEFVNHYLLEGVDRLFLIDDNSTDDYLKLNEEWLNPLINDNKVVILKSQGCQVYDYDIYSNLLKEFEWVIMCDADEFFFSVSKDTTLKELLQGELSKYDCVMVPWKLFKHTDENQPISVIENNTYTHESSRDRFSGSGGYKYIAKVKNVIRYNIHFCKTLDTSNNLKIVDCHNNIIQNNHYRTQSNEFLRNVKSVRGGGVHKSKYKNYEGLIKMQYDKDCSLLKDKRVDLIKSLHKKEQLQPKSMVGCSHHKTYQ